MNRVLSTRTFGPSAKKTGYRLERKKNETGSITYGTDRENEVSKIVTKTLGLKRGGRFKLKQHFEFRGRYND